MLKRSNGRRLQFTQAAKSSKQPKKKQVSHDEIDRLKTKLKLSGKKTALLNQSLRVITNNRKIVAPNYKQHQVEKSKKEEDFFQ